MSTERVSLYGTEVDDLISRWRVIEDEHDAIHPDRSECGGVGRCSMMRAGHMLEEKIMDALGNWRRAWAG